MNFPRDKNQYILTTTTADSATVHKAKHVNPVTREEAAVGIKIFDIYKIEDIYSFITQLHKSKTLDHENIVKVHCSFLTDDGLWVVMSPGTPIRSIIRARFRQGLPENAVAVILRETLKAVHYMHGRNEVCEDIGGECVCFDDECRVKIRVNSITRGHRSGAGMKPEFVTEFGDGKSKANDVLRLGFFALELFYGEVPANLDELRSLMGENKQEKLRGLGMIVDRFGGFSCFGRERRRMPRALAEVVAACLSRNPATTSQLMEFRYFQTRLSGKGSLHKLLKK